MITPACPLGVDTTVTSVRERQITRLLWASLILGIATFATSMVFFGFNTFFLNPVGFGLSSIFSITLLALTAKERRLVDPAAQPAKQEKSSEKTNVAKLSASPIPSILAKPAIFFSFFMALYWLAAVALLIMTIVLSKIYKWDLPEDHSRVIVCVLELVFNLAHIGVTFAMGVLCIKERRARSRESGALKWYQLGY